MYALARMALTSTIPDVEDLPSLGRIYASSRTLAIERSPLSLKDVTLLAAASSFDSVGAYISGREGEMTIGGQPVPISVAQVSAGLFPAMRGHAASGRLLSVNDTGKRLARLNPPSEWITKDVPELRVVSDELWQSAKARQASVQRKWSAKPKRPWCAGSSSCASAAAACRRSRNS